MNKNGFLAIAGTGLIVAIIFFFSNFNIDINTKGGNEQVLSTNNQTDSMHGAGAGDSMASHHGAAQPADASIFNGLIGKAAPNFTLDGFDGKKMTLSDFKGKNVILFFNEGLMCYPACWNQIAAFGKDKDLSSKAVILNITADPANDWKQAITKMPELSVATVLFDSNRQVSQLYGVLSLPSSMHKGQFPGHTYVLINKEGIVKFVKDDVQMAVRNQEISAEIDKL